MQKISISLLKWIIKVIIIMRKIFNLVNLLIGLIVSFMQQIPWEIVTIQKIHLPMLVDLIQV